MIALAELYDSFNHTLFGRELPQGNFRLDLSRHCVLDFVLADKAIVVGNEMAVVSIDCVVDEMVHVMVHVKNCTTDVADCNQNQYHNQRFMEAALQVGLFVAWHKSRGWSVTFSDPKSIKRMKKLQSPEVAAQGLLAAAHKLVEKTKSRIAEFQTEIRRCLKSRPKKTYLVKYHCQCPAPYNAIRSGRRPSGSHPLNIKCNICNATFSPVGI